MRLRKILTLAIKTYYLLKHKGFAYTLAQVAHWLEKNQRTEPRQESLYDYISDVDINNPIDLTGFQRRTDKNKLVLNWVIPDYGIGSGGHMTIFRTIYFLEKFGHTCNIFIFGNSQWRNEKIARDIIREHFVQLEAKVYIGLDNIPDSDGIVATSWQTAYPVFNIRNTKQKFYFVQDFEPMFYPMGSDYIFAENTYRFGFECITAGRWLAKKMKDYGNNADYFDLAYEPDIYKPQKEKEDGKRRVAFYARHVTPRRGFELGVEALRLVKSRYPNIEIIFYGWPSFHSNIPFEYVNKGILSHRQLAELYSISTVGLCISLTNYSLIPQEMMACKLPVVDVKGDNTLTIFGEENKNIYLAEPTPHALANAILELLTDEDKRQAQIESAYEYVKQFDWEKSVRKIEAIIKRAFPD
ncbi:MAG: glycosyltransferase family 4 protein [Paenibacillus sp.]|nr:glycosyltransferase family 4 protein [Paenibacillus sp.]